MKFIDDLVSTSDISNDHFDLLIKEFNENPWSRFKDVSKFSKLCLDNNIDEKKANFLRNVIHYILDFIIEERDFQNGIDRFENDILKYHPVNVKEPWVRIKNAIPNLSGFINVLKEEDLKSISKRLNELRLICDIRPLFNIERKAIIKNLYPIILSIKARDSREKLIFELDEDDLMDIKKEVDFAISKLAILKK